MDILKSAVSIGGLYNGFFNNYEIGNRGLLSIPFCCTYTLDFFQYISDWRRILYFVSAGYGQENLFSEGSAANFICYKSVCKYAAEFYCHFCGFDCFAVHFKSSCDALPAGNYGSGVYIGAGICYGNERSYGVYTGCRICDRYCGDGMAVFNAYYVFD